MMSENEEIDSIDESIASYVGTLPGLLVPSDIPTDQQDKYFPVLNKINPLSNLSQEDEVVLKRSLEILWYMKDDFSYEDLVRLRMHYIPSLSLGRDGFAVKRLTEVNKSINYTERAAQAQGGFFSRVLRRR